MESFIGRRIEFNGELGTVRYHGPLKHTTDGSAGGVWLGVEWDNASKGKHNGTVNGVKYFECANSKNENSGGSLIKAEKANFGCSMKEAIIKKYRSYEEMTTEEKEAEAKLEEEMYVNTTKKDKKLTIELVGKEKAYQKLSRVETLKEVAMQNMNISSVDNGTRFLEKTFLNLQTLYLDFNLLNDWSQYFYIIFQLPKLHTLSLTENRFAKPVPELLESLPPDQRVHPSLRVLSLIGMELDWKDIDVLLPSFQLIEELWLCRNKCTHICSQHKVRLEYLQNLKMLNLEDNQISSWSELDQFHSLPQLTHLFLHSNQIKEVPVLSGLQELTYLSLDKNLIDTWKSVDNISVLPKLRNLRIADNPFEAIEGKMVTRLQIVAKIRTLESLNSSKISPAHRRDAELMYLRKMWEEYLKSFPAKEEVKNPDKVSSYMKERHPRWFDLIAQYGNPGDTMTEIAKEVPANIESTSITLVLRSMCKNSIHKEPAKKKFPFSMTVGALKGVCSKIFNVDMLKIRLSYHSDKSSFPYDLDDNLREIGYYALRDGAEIWIYDCQPLT